jgi:c-di-GMP-binding flagellar brake protein YcgR
MFQERKEYRKKFSSSGRIYLAGEELDFTSYDVSVKGMRIELIPEGLISNAEDIENLMKEISVAEIYVEELMMTGEVDLVWVNTEDDKITMGLEFRDVIYNAYKLWRKRRFFRKALNESGRMIVDNKSLEFECRDFSVDGMQLYLKDYDAVKIDSVVKLVSETRNVKALAKIIWLNKDEQGEGATLGLRYLQIE